MTQSTSLEDALRPFAAFAENVDEDGWASNIHRERISDWFGPSDFRNARAALSAHAARPADDVAICPDPNCGRDLSLGPCRDADCEHPAKADDVAKVIERLRWAAAHRAASADNGGYLCPVTIKDATDAAALLASLNAERDRLADLLNARQVACDTLKGIGEAAESRADALAAEVEQMREKIDGYVDDYVKICIALKTPGVLLEQQLAEIIRLQFAAARAQPHDCASKAAEIADLYAEQHRWADDGDTEQFAHRAASNIAYDIRRQLIGMSHEEACDAALPPAPDTQESQR